MKVINFTPLDSDTILQVLTSYFYFHPLYFSKNSVSSLCLGISLKNFEISDCEDIMCVIHLIHYLGCGHKIPDTQAMVNSRCDAVSAGLIFYHNQPCWQPLDEPLTLPRTCQAVHPPKRGVVKDSVLTEQAQWDDWMSWQFEHNGFGASQRRDLMTLALGPVQILMPNTQLPYPANQLHQYYALVKYQKRRNKAPNVIVIEIPGGCGRGAQAKCSIFAAHSDCEAGEPDYISYGSTRMGPLRP